MILVRPKPNDACEVLRAEFLIPLQIRRRKFRPRFVGATGSNRRGPMQASPALLSVDLLTVADLCDDDDSVAIIDRIHDAIIALSYAVLVLFARVFPIHLDADPLPRR